MYCFFDKAIFALILVLSLGVLRSPLESGQNLGGSNFPQFWYFMHCLGNVEGRKKKLVFIQFYQLYFCHTQITVCFEYFL